MQQRWWFLYETDFCKNFKITHTSMHGKDGMEMYAFNDLTFFYVSYLLKYAIALIRKKLDRWTCKCI